MEKGKKAKVLWVSDLVTPTGFSRVAHSIIENLEKEYEIVGIGINYRGDPHQYNFPIYPASAGKSIFGEDRLISILNNVDFDILFILNDAWIINNYLTAIKKNVSKKLPKIVVYFPVDSELHDPGWYANFDIVTKAVTYTEFAKNVVNDESCVPDLKLDIIPHGIKSELFYKKFTNRRDAKKALYGGSRNPDSFIFLNANRNQPRKKLDITMNAFKLFADGKDDVLLHMHCGVRDASMDIPRLAKRLGIDSKLVLTSLNIGVQMVPDSVLNDIYNAADAGVTTTLGEGWGLTPMEHAITGAPQIVPSHSACFELFKDCGLLVEPKLPYTFDNTMTVGGLVSAEDVAQRMEDIYTNKDLYNDLSNKSIEKFSDNMYSWKEISKQWDNIFKEALNSDASSISK